MRRCLSPVLVVLLFAAAVPARAEAVALFPMANFTGAPDGVEAVEERLRAALEGARVPLVAAETLEAFFNEHRVRYTAGINRSIAVALRETLGVESVLLPTLDLQDPGGATPRIALTCRLTSTGDRPEVLWMESVALDGDDHPGFLDLGVVRDLDLLTERAVREIQESYLTFREGAPAEPPRGVPRRFGPQLLHVDDLESPAVAGKRLSVAVIPFTNQTSRRQAGELMMLHLVRQLVGRTGAEIVEPGVVRKTLLDTRTIPARGVSLPQADLLRESLGVDLIVSGNLFEYVDGGGPAWPPRVAWSVVGLNTERRSVAFTAFSAAGGGDGILLFDRGRVRTASTLADLLAGGVIEAALRPAERTSGRGR